MSIIWADFPSASAGIYSSTTARTGDGLWVTFTGVLGNDPDPNVGAAGKCPAFGQSDSARFVMPTATTTAGIACRYYRSIFTTSAMHNVAIFHSVTGAGGSAQVTVCVDINGYIKAYRGDAAGTLLGTTTVPVITANTWRHIECKVFCSDTVGTVEVRVEGVAVLTLTGQDTKSHATDANIYSLGFKHDNSASTNTMYLKDIVFWDGLGSVNNSFIGTCGVYWRPVASDTSSGWTKSSGTSDYQLLNESPPVDTGYISAPAALPAASIMGFSTLPTDIVSIRGLISIQRGMKSDSGDGSIQMGLSPNNVTYSVGTNAAMSTAFTYYKDIVEISPVTSVAWTTTEFGTLKMRINRTV